MPFSYLGVSLLGEDTVRIGQVKGRAGAGFLVFFFGFREEQLELLLVKGNLLLPLEPSPELLLPWGESLLVRTVTEVGPY